MDHAARRPAEPQRTHVLLAAGEKRRRPANRPRGTVTDESWNPTTGCTRISPGCAHCWAERMALRLQRIGQPRYAQGFAVTTHEDLLDKPLHWAKPRHVYVSFMGDLFHDEVPEEFVARVFEVIVRCPAHRFHLLTKRPERLARMSDRLPWPSNVWAGVTVEDAAHRWRADLLRRVPAAVRYLVLEPLLGPIDALDLHGIGWVILGGESGPGARPLHADWVRAVRDQCVAAGVPFCFKQWGGVRRKETGRELDGRLWTQSPREAGQLAFDDMPNGA